MPNSTMKAVCTHDYGNADQLQLENIPLPAPGSGQVRVRLLSAGVNPADWKMRSGHYQRFMPLHFPWTPGLEGAGVVDQIGAGVVGFQPGQPVLGAFNGAYAEYAIAAAEDLVAKPEKLSYEEAASIPVGALTAWQALEDTGLQPGQRLLVQGGAGGVGMYVVQLAVARGIDVIATASGANLEFVRSLGADEVIDYTTQDFAEVVHDVDAVIDTVGGEVMERSWPTLKPDGILITIVSMLTPEQAQAHGKRGKRSGRAPAAALQPIVALIEAGQVKPAISRVFPLAEAADAQRMSETGHGRGRIVLHIAG
ncbi:MAG: NADP-dependent oxidoreductase [Chloroflexi bacterium]|nr:NADP-dependent oxidoreductase [Chloroflexota bacterium]